MRLAAIDIGSNSIHMVLVDAWPGGRFEIIAREKEMVRLAAGAMHTHHLSRARIDSALDVLTRYVKFSQARGAERILATATSAVREASNRDDFVARVRAATGIKVQILSGIEEARLIALAVTEAIQLENQRALIIDIGGGSTEFIITVGKDPKLLLSMRLGAVRLAERAALSDPPKKKELAKMRARLEADLARTAQEICQLGFDQVIGTSGTILSLVSLAAQSGANREAALNDTINAFSQKCTLAELAAVNETLAGLSLKERMKVPGLDPSRADIIVAGGQLLEAILRAVRAKEIITCDWALREGVLLNYIAKHTNSPHVDLGIPGHDERALDVRDKTVLSVARRYEYEPRHAHQVAWLAGRLFDELRPLHNLTDEDRVLLQYAALLHDIGYHISHTRHHHHAYYLIQNAELPGFSGTESAIIANLVRFHRGGRPRRKRHPEFALLDRNSRLKVRSMTAILRLADALDRSHNAIVDSVKAVARENYWEVAVSAKENSELELWYANSSAEYFQRVFKTRLVITNSKNSSQRQRETEDHSIKKSQTMGS